VRLVGLAYRAHNPRWAFAQDSGDGAAMTGGRFNRPGVRTLYTSLRFETAWLEAQQAFPFKAQPLTLCACDVDCEDIIDLTDQAALAEQAVAASDLACAWQDLATRGIRPPSWQLAERLIASGIAGAIVPSFAAGAGAADRNVVFWDWTRQSPHQLRVIDDEHRLPSDAASWPSQ